MTENPYTARSVAAAQEAARGVSDAMQRLCRTTYNQPGMTPTDVEVVLAHLATAVPALAQATRQLSDILERATHDLALTTDDMTQNDDPAHAIDAARRHLGDVYEPARDLHRLLDAARNEVAHIAIQRDATRRPSPLPPPSTPSR